MDKVLTPELSSRFGAPMGRSPWGGVRQCGDAKIYLRQIPINGGGYDSGGAYWGARPKGLRLFGWHDAEQERRGYLDARNREDAKRRLREENPAVRFFR